MDEKCFPSKENRKQNIEDRNRKREEKSNKEV